MGGAWGSCRCLHNGVFRPTAAALQIKESTTTTDFELLSKDLNNTMNSVRDHHPCLPHPDPPSTKSLPSPLTPPPPTRSMPPQVETELHKQELKLAELDSVYNHFEMLVLQVRAGVAAFWPGGVVVRHLC